MIPRIVGLFLTLTLVANADRPTAGTESPKTDSAESYLCKKVRDDGGYWSQVEAYIEERTEARFTHGLCPDCYQTAIDHHHEEMRRKRHQKRSGPAQTAQPISLAAS